MSGKEPNRRSLDPALLRNPIHLLALGFGSGLAPRAPGTFGTLVAVPIVWGVMQFGFAAHVAFAIVATAAGIWLCGESARRLGVHDHPGIVWDEITAFMIVLFFTPNTLMWQAVAFLLFRVFDILKPGPIRYIERMFRGGFGVMVDDLVAAFFALICLVLLKLLLPNLGGWLGPGTL